MKLLPFLFAIYLLALSLMPCTDSSVCMDGKENVHMELASDTDSDHHQHEDTCTPFCSCNCCGISMAILSFEKFVLEAPLKYVSTTSVVNQHATTRFLHSFWQPPKI